MLVLLFAVAGCGGGKKNSAAPATTASGSTTTSAASTTVAAPSFASAKNCRQLEALAAKMSQALQTSAGNGLDGLGDEANIFKTLASAAPSEIRGDFETFAEAFSGYAKALSSAKIKPGTTATAAQIAALTAAAKSFSTPKLQAAEQHLAAWGQKNCGVGSSTTG